MVETNERAAAYASALREATEAISPPWRQLDWRQAAISWRFFYLPNASLPYQGWKIHVSAGAVEAAACCRTVVPILIRLGAAFKFPRTLNDIILINSGDYGVCQLGKVVTIYPTGDEHAAQVATEVDRVWKVSRGPEVQTDLHIRPGSAVSIRFGVFGTGQITIDSSGKYDFALRGSDGALAPDERLLEGKQSPLATRPPLRCYPPRRPPIALNETLSFNERRYIAIALLRDSPKSRIFLGTRLDTLDAVILKVANPGVGGDDRGEDAATRLKKEFGILVALSRERGLAPEPLHWIEGEWPILIIDDLRGDLLSEMCPVDRVQALPQLARAVERLHAAGYVHGDLKLENVIGGCDHVRLIDFELAQTIGTPMSQAGTPGYLAPEIHNRSPASPARDVYALGCCLAEAVLGIPLGILNVTAGRLVGLLILEGAGPVAEVVRRLAHPHADRRPSAKQARIWIEELPSLQVKSIRRLNVGGALDDRNWSRRAAVSAGFAAESYAVPQRQGQCWRNEHFMNAFHSEGINLGASGIMLGLATIDHAFGRVDFTKHIKAGAMWLASESPCGKSAGLFTGNAGAALGLAVASLRFENEVYLRAAKTRLAHASEDERECDLFCGAAGVLWASVTIHAITGEQWALDAGARAAATLARRHCHRDGLSHWLIDADTDGRYYGCAHGSAGVAMALSIWGAATGDTCARELALATFHELYRESRIEDGGTMLISAHSDVRHAKGSWCHGVAGYVWCMLQGPGDLPELSEEIDWAVELLHNENAIGTPTYCHGVAGQLELWRMLRAVPRWREVATVHAEKAVKSLRLLHEKKRRRVVWRSDDPTIVTPDLWVGFLGPATALAMDAVGMDCALLSAHWLSSCAGKVTLLTGPSLSAACCANPFNSQANDSRTSFKLDTCDGKNS